MKEEIIFVHIPKTAGSSLRQIIKDERITLINHNIRKTDYKYLKEYIKNKENERFIFTFVRNPWDRAVSTFFYLSNGGNCELDEKDNQKYLKKYNKDFDKFVKEAFKTKEIFNQLHFKPQYEWICDDEDNLLTNYIGKFETLQKDINKLSKTLKIDFEMIPHLNKSKHKYYKEYYNEETKKIIAKVYKKDIELFNYKF